MADTVSASGSSATPPDGPSTAVPEQSALAHDAPRDDDAEALYERAPCGYLSTTPDGVIVRVNGTFLSWTGYRRDELVDRKMFAELLTGGGRIYHETHYAPLLRMQGVVREIALDIVCADGRRLPALVNSVLERDAGGEPQIIRVAVFDGTERREYERELLRAKVRAEASEQRARDLARSLQATLIPPAHPEIPGIEIAAAYRPAGSGEEVGGDFYDVFEIGRDEWVIAIGDVQGKGIEAAAVTALVRYSIRAAAVRTTLPSDVLRTVNAVLLRHETDRFCTVAIIRLRRRGGNWTATTSSGGHALPLLLRPDDRPFTIGASGTLLGVFEDPKFYDADLTLQPGDRVVTYTDGVTEARRGHRLFGEDGLADAIHRSAAAATSLTETILHDVLEFQAGFPRDDIAIVSIRIPDDDNADPDFDDADSNSDSDSDPDLS